MRLTKEQVRYITDAVRELDPSARVSLHGSRTDPTLKGGDIDLIVLSDRLRFADKVSILVAVKANLGEQKIDLTLSLHNPKSWDAFVRAALSQAIELVR